MSASLWTSADAQKATGGQLTGAAWSANGISIDTRSLAPGELFVALTDQRDGHDFVGAAFKAGASAALVSRKVDADGPQLIVSEVLEGLRGLAAAARDRSAAIRVAVTGSVGKTTVKSLIADALVHKGVTHSSVKSFNNHWGVPLTLARMPQDSQFGVFEIGMNHADEIRPLTKLVQPHLALVTTVEAVHLEHFESVDGIADAKAEIFEGLVPGGAAIINADNPYADRLILRAKEAGVSLIVRYGRAADCEARLLDFQTDGESCDIDADVFGKRVEVRIPAPGAFWANNGLAVLAATGALFDGDCSAGAQALAEFSPLPGRGQVRRISAVSGIITVVDDTYNANPTSMAASIRTLGGRPVGSGGRRIAALGDMLELGADEALFHRGMVEPIEAARLDLVFCAGPRMKALWDALPDSRRGGYAEKSDDLAPLIAGAVRGGDVVLVKGSAGSRMAKVAEALSALGAANVASGSNPRGETR
ncbi:MAG: UDP-N-acetylmuramoylalanyl-D-glutamyl-2,6-diaminopimelate--D-alanyl-D-alanine ligase [Caulobacterales bacterium]